jgi:hypothetical protein
LQWSRVNDSALAGYKLYFSKEPQFLNSYVIQPPFGPSVGRHLFNFKPTDSGDSYFAAVAFDKDGNESPHSNVVSITVYSSAPMTREPRIRSQGVTQITSKLADVAWATTTPTDGQVHYGESEELGLVAVANTEPTTEHAVRLSGLTTRTTYYYRPVSHDAAGNAVIGEIRSFVTK